jgi:hypothetical protein
MTQPAALSDEELAKELRSAYHSAYDDEPVGVCSDFFGQGYLAEARRARELLGAGRGAVPADVDALGEAINLYVYKSDPPWRPDREGTKSFWRKIASYVIQRYGAPPASPDQALADGKLTRTLTIMSTEEEQARLKAVSAEARDTILAFDHSQPDLTLPRDAEKLGRLLANIHDQASPVASAGDIALGTYVFNLQRALREENARLRGALEGMVEEFDGSNHASTGSQHKPNCACCVALKQAVGALTPTTPSPPAEAPGCAARWEWKRAADGTKAAEAYAAEGWKPFAVTMPDENTVPVVWFRRCAGAPTKGM